MDSDIKKIAKYLGQTNPVVIELLGGMWSTFSKEVIKKEWAPVDDITLKTFSEWLERENNIWR